jgi:hypothetical protein
VDECETTVDQLLRGAKVPPADEMLAKARAQLEMATYAAHRNPEDAVEMLDLAAWESSVNAS